MAGQHQRTLDRFRNDFGRAGRAQALEVAVIDRSHHHRHLWRTALHQMQDLQRRGRVGIADDDRACACQACGHQALQPRRIAENNALSGSRRLPHPVRVEVERDIGDLFTIEQARQVLAAAAIAADDHMGVDLDRLPGDRGQLQRLQHPVTARQFHDHLIAEHDHERRGQHRQHHAGQHRAAPLRCQQLVLHTQRQQHEAEFARLCQIDAGAQGHAGRRLEQLGQPGDQDELGQHWQQAQEDHQMPLLDHQPPIELHADADEEQAQQHIVEGPDVGLHLMLVFGLGNQDAGDKGAQRQRQPGMLGQPGQAQRHQQQVQHEQLGALAPRHQSQPPAHQALPANQQQRQQQHGLQAGPGQRLRHLRRAAVQSRDHHQQRHHRQILEQQHADDAPAMFTVEF